MTTATFTLYNVMIPPFSYRIVFILKIKLILAWFLFIYLSIYLFIYLFMYLPIFCTFVLFWIKAKLNNFWNCGYWSLKEAQVEICGILYIDAINVTLRILAARYFYLNICGTMQITRWIKLLFNFHGFWKKISTVFHNF